MADKALSAGPGQVMVTVANGQTIIADPPGPLGKGTRYLPGQKCVVAERDVPLMIARGIIIKPQTEAPPTIAEPPPIAQPVPKVTIETAG